jgi:hypothetical protein
MKNKKGNMKNENDLAGIERGIFIFLIGFITIVSLCFFEKWGWI